MNIFLNGDPKEIAALVLAIQERYSQEEPLNGSGKKETGQNPEKLADSLKRILVQQAVQTQQQGDESNAEAEEKRSGSS